MSSKKIFFYSILFFGFGLLAVGTIHSSSFVFAQDQEKNSDPDYIDCGSYEGDPINSDDYFFSSSKEKISEEEKDQFREEFEKIKGDETLQCLGEAALNCNPAQGKITAESLGELEWRIKGKKTVTEENCPDCSSENFGERCVWEVEFGEEKQISEKDSKKFAQTTLGCPLYFGEKLKQNEPKNIEIDLEKNPETLVPLYFPGIFIVALFDRGKVCHGDFFDQMDKKDFFDQKNQEDDTEQYQDPQDSKGDKENKKGDLAPVSLNSQDLSSKARQLRQKLQGKITLRVESNGEAHYINPQDLSVHSLGRPANAFRVMRRQGVGISGQDLSKIRPAVDEMIGEDTDGDGLPDAFEEAVGTDSDTPDTDGDGYTDLEELQNGYNPQGMGKLNIDTDFAQKQQGKILLQVEDKGQAWYVSPENSKRYFLGKPANAFHVMRNLGQGISEEDFNKLNQEKEKKEEKKKVVEEEGCEYGKEVGGGIVAECNDQGEPILIAMKEDIAKEAKWGCKGEKMGAESESDGESNTQKIIKNCQEEGIAARLCAESEEGGYNDWYLPAEDDFFLVHEDSPLHDNLIKNDLGNFSQDHYWSSTEGTLTKGRNRARQYKFDDTGLAGTFKSKDSTYRVRCVRSP